MLISVVSCGALLCIGALGVLGLWLHVAAATVVFCLAELTRARARLRVLRSVDSDPRGIRTIIPTELTLRTALLDAYEVLKAQEWERDVTSQISRPLEEHPLIKELTEASDLKKFSTVELYQRVLTIVAGFTRAQAAGVVFKTEAGASITAYGVAGRRFERHLRALGEEYWRGNSAVLGLHDAFAKNAVWGGAGSFGHRFALVLPFASMGAAGNSILWLGYAHGSQPTFLEREAAERLVHAVSEALRKANAMAALDTRAATAEVEKKHADQMLAHISHDIRTPLANVKGILHLLSTPHPQKVEEIPELTRVALQNCEELGELICDVIDFTRGRSGQLASRKANVDLEGLCRETVLAFSVAAKQRGLSLQFSSDGPALINGDPGHLKRAISNLVSNALKYTVHGEVSVRLEVQASQALIIVKDTGLGMTLDQLSKVFTPFSRFHVERAEGIGLGLAITKLFIEEHEGKVEVDSTLNVGTTFTLDLPLQSEREERRMVSAQNFTTPLVRVLLVDDDLDVGASLARLLRQGGCVVDCMSSVNAARAGIAKGIYSVVVTDLSMPGGGGRAILDAAQALGDSAPAVFVLTGDFNSDSVAALKARGALDVFEKPVDHVVLLTEIRLVAQRRSQTQALEATN